ncbi:MAG TPA: ABC transporter permease [Anaerolineae bacterium]|nr:ABC transporter permease [Anaerolineae bacterium]
MIDSVTAPVVETRPEYQRFSLQRLLGWSRERSLMTGAIMLIIILAASFLTSWFSPYTPIEQDLTNTLKPPSLAHPFGTDNFGRDIFTRVMVAAQLDLQIAFISILFPFALGVVLGSLSGYLGGVVDALVMRTVDIISAFPFMVIVIAIIAMLGPGLESMYVALTLVVWRSYARIIRGEILVLKKSDYVSAARALSFSNLRIMFRHILPNVVTPAIVFAMSDVVLILLSTTSLSFLGLGVQPPTAEWGNMVAEGRTYMITSWWLITFPGLAIVIVGIALSLFGDGLVNLLRTEG